MKELRQDFTKLLEIYKKFVDVDIDGGVMLARRSRFIRDMTKFYYNFELVDDSTNLTALAAQLNDGNSNPTNSAPEKIPMIYLRSKQRWKDVFDELQTEFHERERTTWKRLDWASQQITTWSQGVLSFIEQAKHMSATINEGIRTKSPGVGMIPEGWVDPQEREDYREMLQTISDQLVNFLGTPGTG